MEVYDFVARPGTNQNCARVREHDSLCCSSEPSPSHPSDHRRQLLCSEGSGGHIKKIFFVFLLSYHSSHFSYFPTHSSTSRLPSSFSSLITLYFILLSGFLSSSHPFSPSFLRFPFILSYLFYNILFSLAYWTLFVGVLLFSSFKPSSSVTSYNYFLFFLLFSNFFLVFFALICSPFPPTCFSFHSLLIIFLVSFLLPQHHDSHHWTSRVRQGSRDSRVQLSLSKSCCKERRNKWMNVHVLSACYVH